MAAPNAKPTLTPEWASTADTVLPWAASTAYVAADLVTNGGNVYEVVTAGTSAGSGGPAGTGQAITDNTVTWRYLGKAGTAGGITEPSPGRKQTGWLAGEKPPHGYFNWLSWLAWKWTAFLDTFNQYMQVWQNAAVFEGPPAWASSTAYVVGEYVLNDGKVYVCTVAGTSAGSGGPTGTGTGIVDNTVTWDFAQLPFDVEVPARTRAGVEVTQSTTNTAAITATGNGTGAGGVFTGGASGAGITAAAGGGNKDGGTFTATGTGSGVNATGGATGAGGTFQGGATSGAGINVTGGPGSTGANITGGSGDSAGAAITGSGAGVGAQVSAGTASTGAAPTTALTLTNGNLKLNGAAPNSDVDIANTVTPANILNVRATVEPNATTPVLHDGAHVLSVATSGANVFRITFKTSFADDEYTVSFGTNNGSYMPIASVMNAAFIEVGAQGGTPLGTSYAGGTSTRIMVQISGRQ